MGNKTSKLKDNDDFKDQLLKDTLEAKGNIKISVTMARRYKEESSKSNWKKSEKIEDFMMAETNCL